MADKVISRDTYRKIKGMSREEMQQFLLSYADNLKADVKEVDMSELRSAIGAVKGIGEKRLDEIMGIIEEYLK